MKAEVLAAMNKGNEFDPVTGKPTGSNPLAIDPYPHPGPDNPPVPPPPTDPLPHDPLPPVPDDFMNLIYAERAYQVSRGFANEDFKNSNNDWVAAITKYAARAQTAEAGKCAVESEEFKSAMIKVATLAFSALRVHFQKNDPEVKTLERNVLGE